jgi:hypothetical protein
MLHLLNLCGSQGATSGNADTQNAQKRKKEKIKTTTMHVVTQAILFFFPNFVM